MRGALPVAGGVAILLAAGLGIALGFGLLRRLERLRRDARRLADEGIEQPLALDGYRDEVGEVALALETMRSRLHAEERGRQAFLATASHELRTPLASLRGTVELLEEELARGAPDLGGIRRRAAAARRQTDRMTSLAEDLLDLGRLDGNAPLASEPVELGELAGTLAAEIARRGARGRRRPSSSTRREPVWATCDPRATARVLRALLENALRHGAPPGSVVTIAVDATGERARLRVIDAGPGVPEAERERIFGRFERGGRAGAGFGLGLAIARGLARQMGGDVSAPPVQSGACFEATLPACAAPVGAAQTTASDHGRRAGVDRHPGLSPRATAAAGGVSHSTGQSWTGSLACMQLAVAQRSSGAAPRRARGRGRRRGGGRRRPAMRRRCAASRSGAR